MPPETRYGQGDVAIARAVEPTISVKRTSNTVKDLVAGSGIEFEERGQTELKGVPGEWRLYAVSNQEEE